MDKLKKNILSKKIFKVIFMEDLMVFTNDKFKTVRMIEENGKILFCASDIAANLGYANKRDAVKRHCKGVVKHDILTKGGNQEVSFIPEGDVYRLIVHSKLPNADQFERWVFEEVLPSINKNGSYIIGQEDLSDEEFMARALIIAQKKLATREERIKRLETDNAVLKPRAEYFDKIVDRRLLTNFRTFAHELHIKQKQLIQYLIDKNYIYRDAHGKLMPYAHKNDGLFDVKEFANNNNYAGTQTLITPKGRETFRIMLEVDGLLPEPKNKVIIND